ncbi:MAG: response regulator [Chryseotalea sp.]|jgi:DNA-binding NarL/FixJ family response regulator
MSKIKLAIAEDHNSYRNKIVEILNRENDFEVTLQASNGKELIEKLESIKPDIILIDIRMPIMDGIEATQVIHKLFPKIKIIALSHYDNDSYIIDMIILGIKSYIRKNDDLNELFNAIRVVYFGGVYMTEYAAQIIQKYLSNEYNKVKSDFNSPDYFNIKKFSDLELEILCQVASLKSIKEIAESLSVSPNTINNRQSSLRKKLNISGKRKLLEYALSIKRHLEQLNSLKSLK